MNILAQIFFAACVAVVAFLVTKRIATLKKTIQLGKPLNRNDQPQKRLKTMLLVAFGQGKMFQKPIVGIMHFVIYAGFLIINIEVLEIIIDGLTGKHRIFAPIIGTTFYHFLINCFEFLAVSVIIVCVAFLTRRYLLPIKRFRMREMTKAPRTDALIILVAEIVLMTAFLTNSATDSLLQNLNEHYPKVGAFAFSQFLMPAFAGMGETTLLIIERTTWWLHILGILSFAVYVTYSKHLHIALAFPNTYFSNLESKGHINNMPTVTNEVKLSLGLIKEADMPAVAADARFGAQDVNDLSWKQLMDAYSCTECGRCTEQCPANQTGKLLSPRKIMMDTRDRLEEVGKEMSKGKTEKEALANGKTLFGDYILKEEVMACTTCNACVDACPINIDPLSIIMEVRRFVAMEKADTPASWNAMFSNLENNMAPWKFSPNDRFNWADKVVNTDK